MDLWCVKACWGNYAFDFVHSDSVGNSGGILCIWDPNSFHKNNVTVSDYFCMVRDVWLKTGVDILMVVVYALQELRDKRILWDNLEHVINQWDEVLNSIQHLDKIKAMDVVQKAKIKWDIEGDKNTRYFHGVLNIRGIMVDGKWTEKPSNVKLEFLHHFRNRFDKPTDNRVHIDMNFPKSITIDQQMDLECAVFKEELKRAVWECGTDKSPGPDGSSFGFYRQFWSSIENDVFAAVSHFFTFGDIPNGCLRINTCKSKIMGVNVGDEKVKYAALKLRCLVFNTSFSYLGTNVGGNMSRVQAWTEVVDKVKSRLSNWKMKSLSIGGRLTLLQSVLGSMPIFHMSIFRVSLTVLHSLASIRCYFFNGHELNSNKASWVKWKNVLASKEKGGLGVSSLYALNRALMMKWVWRFYSQKESIWARVIKAIYGDDEQVGNISKAGSRSCWRNIVNEVRILSNQGIKVLDYMRIKLENGESTAFWDDNWIGGKVLKYSFPRIYALETEKEVAVNSKMSDTMLENSLRRSIRGGVEHVQFNELSDMLQSVSLMPYSDRCIDIDSIICPIRECGVESARHVFFSYNLVRQIVRKVCSWWDVMYIDVNSYVEWFNWMNSLRLKSKSKLKIEGVFYVVWWHVWTFRNKLLFEDKKSSKTIIFDDVVSRSYYW
uniref:RNA-directed DNA polymerase, eukaryota, reverse transcriptase zinc-binding domain protein n=1 Tax=Tanacetum cinerariifolium TaxID=118510 RepID=A0A6L2JVW5_TANCI|nr:RNA-directed DNA polymerase, eukaryota, reverse transcriptase zinc-binding domain protein [Tanacetum cinerariifolium]